MALNPLNRLEQARLALKPVPVPVIPLHQWKPRRIRIDRCSDTFTWGIVHLFQEAQVVLALADILMLEAAYDALLEDMGGSVPAVDLGWRMDTWFTCEGRIRYNLHHLTATGLVDHHIYALVDYFRINAAGVDTLNALFVSSAY